MKNETPILFPYDPEMFWEKMKELVKIEMQRMQSKEPKEVQYTTPGMVQKPLYKAYEVCEMFDISRQTLHQWVKEGILKQYKIKSRSFFLWADLQKLILPDGK
jgi:hypothetical protein